MTNRFLPISRKDMESRGWDALDIVIITGDAYVDHPSYGAAVIGRVLESAGFRVGIIAQPDPKRLDDFKRLGRPRLFFGVTAGNLDSMVANFTANKKPRSEDEYAPGGKGGLRPDRATIIYTNKAKEAFPGVSVVIGGVEASLRRLAHYDYWSDTLRRSILLDAKADILVYGMGERQTLEIARRLKEGAKIQSLDDIHGIVIIKNLIDGLKDYISIPSFEEVSRDKDKFNLAFKTIYLESDPFRGKTIVQKHGERFVVQLPGALPLSEAEMDRVYDLDYAGGAHPKYDGAGGVPGFATVASSIISHRGCPGACSFCSLYFHQGRIVQSRSARSIIDEIKKLAREKGFTGTITDIGGPTANLYKATCELWKGPGTCRDKLCLMPSKCKSLKCGYAQTISLWEEAKKIPGVNNIFISSGVRYDLLIDKDSDEYLKALCKDHVSGRLKVAPEHCDNRLLGLMNKPVFEVYERFVNRFDDVNKRSGKKQYLVHYFIASHPGSTLEEALTLALLLKRKHIHAEQIQDYLPLPMTASSCMYYTEKDPFTGSRVYVAKGLRERKLQRAIIQFDQPENKRYVIEALRKLDKMALAKTLLGR